MPMTVCKFCGLTTYRPCKSEQDEKWCRERGSNWP